MSVQSSPAAGDPNNLPPHTRIFHGKYEIIRKVGKGGMGAVYEARHVDLHKRVAIKILNAETRDPEIVNRFLREGRAASRVRHPHVLEILDVDLHDDRPFLVMTFLDGIDLRTLYERGLDRHTQRLAQAPRAVQELLAKCPLAGPLPPGLLVELMTPVLSGMEALHAVGVVHRDLKPDNIFLHHDGAKLIPIVVDFGISKLLDENQTRDGLTMGTPSYMAPEQIGDATKATQYSDQYALGVIIYGLFR